MSRLTRAEMASYLDEDKAEAMDVDSTLVVQFTPALRPAAMVALRVPARACERIWDELEALHKKTFG